MHKFTVSYDFSPRRHSQAVGLIRSMQVMHFPSCPMSLLLLALLLLFSPAPGQAEGSDSCSDCLSRKMNLCAVECAKVDASRVPACQKRCLGGYCQHRCKPDAPELKALLEETCSSCQDRQYGLCGTECSVGSPRERAACQLPCAEARCALPCDNQALLAAERAKARATPTPKPKRSEDDEDFLFEDEEGGSDKKAQGGEGADSQEAEGAEPGPE